MMMLIDKFIIKVVNVYFFVKYFFGFDFWDDNFVIVLL